jgi:membrane protease YdiL (CAAX protease family)
MLGLPLGPLGLYHVILVGLFVPWMAWRSKKKLEAIPAEAKTGAGNRVRHHVTTLGVEAFFCGLSLLVALREGLALFPPWTPSARDVLLGVGALAALVAYMRPRWRRNVETRVRVVELFSPRTGVERALWLAVSFAAGISEEITYRGVLFLLLHRVTGSVLAATLLAAAAFGLGHLVQGRSSVLVISGIALVTQTLVLVTGTLLVAMAVHVAYDIAAGLVYGRLARQRDARDAAESAAAAPVSTPAP